jgi:hypothetical protein
LKTLARKQVEDGVTPETPSPSCGVHVKFNGNITPSLRNVIVAGARSYPSGKIVFDRGMLPARPNRDDVFEMIFSSSPEAGVVRFALKYHPDILQARVEDVVVQSSGRTTIWFR